MGTLVKICGLRTVEHALAAVEAGADMLGFIFAPARRQIAPEAAADIAAAVRAFQLAQPDRPRVRLVGVFVNETSARMAALARACDLDVLQLSGDEAVQQGLELLPHYPIFKAVRFNGTPHEQGWFATAPSPRLRLMVEAQVNGAYGGTGAVADWPRAAGLARQREAILAGGLDAANVAAAIRQVRPWGVDVSSGVETNGVKDSAKIRAFITAVRTIDQERGI